MSLLLTLLPLRLSWFAVFLTFILLDVVLASTVRLTITDTLVQQRTDRTQQVILEGLDDCSTYSVTTLEVFHETESLTIKFKGQQGTAELWSGNEIGDIYDGTVRLMATRIRIPSTSADSEDGRQGILLSEVLMGDAVESDDSSPCRVTAHMSSGEFMESIIMGTLADGTVWADIIDDSIEADTPEVEVEYDQEPLIEPFVIPEDLEVDSGALIQLNVPYTGEALCFEAGLSFPCDFTQTTSIINRIIFLLNEANQILENSQSGLRIQGIRAWRTEDYNEGIRTFSSTMSAMQTANDGIFQTPSLLNLRESDCVDLVGLITRDGDTIARPGFIIFGQARGIGPSSAAWTFVSSLDSRAVSGYTFTHELGHVLGCRHDIAGDPNPPTYAHGYLSGGGTYSSVMTRRSVCSTSVCTRFPVFSNPPPFSFNGRIMGDSTNANNVRRIEETRFFMANLRDSTTCGPTPPTPPPTPQPTPFPTPFPTPQPTPNPTPFPTPQPTQTPHSLTGSPTNPADPPDPPTCSIFSATVKGFWERTVSLFDGPN